MDDNDSLLAAFVHETAPLAAEVERGLLDAERDAATLHGRWRSLLGTLHTIKGNCGMVDLDQAAGLAHAMEQRVRDVRRWPAEVQASAISDLLVAGDRLRAAVSSAAGADAGGVGGDADAVTAETERLRGLDPVPPAAVEAEPLPGAAGVVEPALDLAAGSGPIADVRVPAPRLDRLLEATGDLAAYHERLASLLRGLVRRRRPMTAPVPPELVTVAELVDTARRRLGELSRAVGELRQLPLSTALVRFDRLVRDLARTTGRRAALRVTGGAVAVDKGVVDALGEPLLHLVRNAVVHGIEPVRDRVRAGKPEDGTVAIEAEARGGVLTVVVRDDGAGVDRRRLAQAAARRGLDVTGWTDAQLVELIFAPEISTAEQVTELSGRGVGLDQARRALQLLGGSLQVTSWPGVGTEFRLRVPLVIAVQRALLVACAGELYALPFTAVIEAIRLPRVAIHAAGAGPGTAIWRDSEIAHCRLADELGAGPDATLDAADPVTCVVIECGDRPLAIEVDALAGQQDVAIKQLDPLFGQPRGVSGAALLADGRIVLMVDPHGLARPTPGGPS